MGGKKKPKPDDPEQFARLLACEKKMRDFLVKNRTIPSRSNRA